MTFDGSAINTALILIFGGSGAFFIWKFVGPILRTQDQHRISQGQEIIRLAEKIKASEIKIDTLEELVTQRAQVDDLRQFMKVSVDENNTQHRLLISQFDTSVRDQSTQHQQMVLALNEMVATLRGIERHIGRDERGHGARGERGAPGATGATGDTGERGEKGDHGQDVPYVKTDVREK